MKQLSVLGDLIDFRSPFEATTSSFGWERGFTKSTGKPTIPSGTGQGARSLRLAGSSPPSKSTMPSGIGRVRGFARTIEPPSSSVGLFSPISLGRGRELRLPGTYLHRLLTGLFLRS